MERNVLKNLAAKWEKNRDALHLIAKPEVKNNRIHYEFSGCPAKYTRALNRLMKDLTHEAVLFIGEEFDFPVPEGDKASMKAYLSDQMVPFLETLITEGYDAFCVKVQSATGEWENACEFVDEAFSFSVKDEEKDNFLNFQTRKRPVFFHTLAEQGFDAFKQEVQSSASIWEFVSIASSLREEDGKWINWKGQVLDTGNGTWVSEDSKTSIDSVSVALWSMLSAQTARATVTAGSEKLSA